MWDIFEFEKYLIFYEAFIVLVVVLIIIFEAKLMKYLKVGFFLEIKKKK